MLLYSLKETCGRKLIMFILPETDIFSTDFFRLSNLNKSTIKNVFNYFIFIYYHVNIHVNCVKVVVRQQKLQKCPRNS